MDVAEKNKVPFTFRQMAYKGVGLARVDILDQDGARLGSVASPQFEAVGGMGCREEEHLAGIAGTNRADVTESIQEAMIGVRRKITRPTTSSLPAASLSDIIGRRKVLLFSAFVFASAP
jgi:hypothetical protein